MTEQNQLNWQRDNFESIEEAWQGDLWDRRRLGEQLTNYVDRLQCGAVLALDARWGEGKTWFVRHWQKHLENEGHNVIYLDAFANDYLDDPFLVISSEITACLSKDDANSSHINTFKEKAAAAYQALLPTLPKVLLTLGLNLISGGVLGTLAQQVYESGEKVIESATDGIGDKIKESIEAKIESHEADKNTLLAFKQELTQLAKEFDKPLVFIIDELDRCRPDFAIRLIERIKHFFDIPKIVFVLVMDKTQFSKVVCHNYGYDEALGEEYLEKFVDFEVSLKKKSLLPYEEIYEIIEEYLSQIGFVRNSSNKGVIGLISVLYLYKKINMRALLKIVNKVSLFQVENNLKNEFLVYLLFDIDVLNRFNKTEDFLEYLRSDLIGLTEYCLLDRIVGIESSMPEEELKKLQGDGLSKLVFNSTLNSELLLNIDMLLEKNEKAYFKIIDWLSKDLFENPYEGNLIENWKKYLFI